MAIDHIFGEDTYENLGSLNEEDRYTLFRGGRVVSDEYDNLAQFHYVKIKPEELMRIGGVALGETAYFSGMDKELNGFFEFEIALKNSVFAVRKLSFNELNLDECSIDDDPLIPLEDRLPILLLDVSYNDMITNSKGVLFSFFYPRRFGDYETKISNGEFVTFPSSLKHSKPLVYEIIDSSFDTTSGDMITYYTKLTNFDLTEDGR